MPLRLDRFEELREFKFGNDIFVFVEESDAARLLAILAFEDLSCQLPVIWSLIVILLDDEVLS